MSYSVFRPEEYKKRLEKSAASGNRAIRKAIEEGEIIRLSRRWIANLDAEPDLLIAATRGCLVGCLTACKIHGLWTPTSGHPHLIYGRFGRKPRYSPELLHPSLNPDRYVGEHLTPGKSPTIVTPLIDSLEHVARYHSTETALIVLESALYNELITQETALAIVDKADNKKSRLLSKASALSQSGSETRVKMFLESLRHQVKQQAYIESIGKVDILVGKSLIIECDSVAHHSSQDQMTVDRRRDMAAMHLGYQVVRLSYQQIWKLWELTKQELKAILATKKHLEPPKRLAGALF
ncbi:MAG: hypothetical protein GX483_04070 [Actinomycetaceae bacterium]|nr:hypothetical protein [Actinomycetaceae bacterium]